MEAVLTKRPVMTGLTNGEAADAEAAISAARTSEAAQADIVIQSYGATRTFVTSKLALSGRGITFDGEYAGGKRGYLVTDAAMDRLRQSYRVGRAA